MKTNKSSLPFLVLVFLIIVGIPIVNHYCKKSQKLYIEVKAKPIANPAIVSK